ncbi:hypothetical protein GUITHDRAFT_99275 [Guillardia theta CCMP2712]|uniref:Uncharacterized protein n=1 Tax=Guillardia theta (strain CCMP2712) TaxID=905079 RepID=L1K4G7_GUITC|nr:hypothetical protein GUITHDRAFT_99275 [Guillardia theta CCMP2712]EKX55499.1 hypothetical protein GUITHDRAFT_99275 [Guillardia theta CCMP2712]|eukprot:XP_005842479.1 hypothetical protein GUITHDRAFT_99275 [Guillardia theta CCMP2712]
MFSAKELSTTKTASSRKLAETLSRAGLLQTPCAVRNPDYLGKRNMPDVEEDKSAVCVSNTRAEFATDASEQQAGCDQAESIQGGRANLRPHAMSEGWINEDEDPASFSFQNNEDTASDADYQPQIRSSSALVARRIEKSLKKDNSGSDSSEEEEDKDEDVAFLSVISKLNEISPTSFNVKLYRKKKSVLRIFQKGSDDSEDETKDMKQLSNSVVQVAYQSRLNKIHGAQDNR